MPKHAGDTRAGRGPSVDPAASAAGTAEGDFEAALRSIQTKMEQWIDAVETRQTYLEQLAARLGEQQLDIARERQTLELTHQEPRETDGSATLDPGHAMPVEIAGDDAIAAVTPMVVQEHGTLPSELSAEAIPSAAEPGSVAEVWAEEPLGTDAGGNPPIEPARPRQDAPVRQATDDLGSLDLDPETLQKLKVLRRLAGPGKTTAELLDLLRQRDAASSTQKGRKKWWQR